jgi:hypothetical protein
MIHWYSPARSDTIRGLIFALALVSGGATAAPALAADEMPAAAAPAAEMPVGGKPAGGKPAGGAKGALPAVDDYMTLPGDPPPMRLKIVDAFKVDGPLTADKIAAVKEAAKKPAPERTPPRVRRTMKSIPPGR